MRSLVLPLAFLAACTSNPQDPRTEVGADACDAYLTCVGAVNPGARDALELVYGEQGICWRAPEVEDPVACENACERGLSQLAEANPDEAACPAPDVDTDTDTDTDTDVDTDTDTDTDVDTDTDPDTDTDTDTDTDPPPFSPRDGLWVLNQEDPVLDSCGITFGGFGEFDVQLNTASDGSGFKLELFGLAPDLVFDCTLSGLDFTCLDVGFGGTFTLGMSGRFSDTDNAAATFAWTYDIPETGATCRADLPATLSWSSP